MGPRPQCGKLVGKVLKMKLCCQNIAWTRACYCRSTNLHQQIIQNLWWPSSLNLQQQHTLNDHKQDQYEHSYQRSIKEIIYNPGNDNYADHDDMTSQLKFHGRMEFSVLIYIN